jgi:hypothetical protein
MSPLELLGLAIAITGVSAMVHRIMRRRWQRAVRALATSWQMHYAPRDQWRLTPRVAAAFPLIGAANVRIIDVVYGTDRHTLRYVFTAEFTLGVVNRKRRLIRAAAFSEPRQSSQSDANSLQLAPANLPLRDQYLHFAPPKPSAE